MTDRNAMWAAILEEPACDTARLVYADRLDELGGAHNHARAEFIRVQVAASKSVPSFGGGPSRDFVLLKKWVASWLPHSLRPGYAVSGNMAACDPLGGYVRFERGFIAHASRELPANVGVDNTVACARAFGERLRSLFAANPLTGFTVSFEGGSGEALSAEITRDEGGMWQLMWDVNTYSLLSRDTMPQPLRCSTRSSLGLRLSSWLADAVRGPAASVAANRELADMLGIDTGPDFLVVPTVDDLELDELQRQYGEP